MRYSSGFLGFSGSKISETSFIDTSRPSFAISTTSTIFVPLPFVLYRRFLFDILSLRKDRPIVASVFDHVGFLSLLPSGDSRSKVVYEHSVKMDESYTKNK